MALADYLVPIQSKANICFDCQKACGRCLWSAKFEPVPGWTAKKTILQVGENRTGKVFHETYHITDCPEFEPDEKRKNISGEVTDDQFALMKAMWKREGWLV
jgi:hypothetical protein